MKQEDGGFFTTYYRAIIVDCAGPELTREEFEQFRTYKPVGFILFQRHCISKDQVRKLISDLRDAVENPYAPILIDQEGGTVARLKSPVWTEFSPARIFGECADSTNIDVACEATRLNARLMAEEMADLGITIDCAPVCDVPSPECHAFLASNRTYSRDPEIVARLSEAVCQGLLEGGITPVIKHIPGHGRATVDSHLDLPKVDACLNDLAKSDFYPFEYLAKKDWHNAVWAMAAHVVYSDIDPDSAASRSPKMVSDIIRDHMGFDGVLIADDISMKALKGTLAEKATATIAAGMDLTMLCNGSFEEREEALKATPNLTTEAVRRLNEAERSRQNWKKTMVNVAETHKKISDLVQKKNVA